MVSGSKVAAHRTVFFVSDRTGITAEVLGNSLLSQFDEFDFQRRTIPFVDTPARIAEVVDTINQTAATEGHRPLVFSSIVDEPMSVQLGRANALFLDLFQVFIAPLEPELDAKSSHTARRLHGIANPLEYFARMEAINFAQAHDDGAAMRDLVKAQVILIGISRRSRRRFCIGPACSGTFSSHLPIISRGSQVVSGGHSVMPANTTSNGIRNGTIAREMRSNDIFAMLETT
jgi:hypothetical protein